MILLDTNVLIEILKGDQTIRQQVEALAGPLAVSSISAMELFFGAINKAEVKRLEKFLGLFQTAHVSEPVSLRALSLIRTYTKSHGLDIPDALIAATALEYKATLLTFNHKDFRFIAELDLQ